MGCKACYQAGACVRKDDIARQMKVFIDRCTPYCDTHEVHAALSAGKKGFAIALRTGQNPGKSRHL